MDLLRTYRTLRHLGASQLAWRPICRGKFVAMEAFPGIAFDHFVRRGERIGAFDFAAMPLRKAVAHVLQLQRTVHGAFLDGIADGRFTLLNREIDFGGLSRVEWRRELGEKNNRLWRMNLSYMGYLVPFVEREGGAAVPVVADLIRSMTEQNPWSSRGVFRDVWHPYSVSHRVINLVTCLGLLDNAGAVVDPAARKVIEDEIRLGAAFVLGNLERDLQFNHLFKNFVCLAVTRAALAEPAEFARRQLDEVAASITQQFLDDGGHAERAPMYHLLSLLDLRILRDSGVLRGDSAATVARTIDAAELAIDSVVHPDGDVALFNDSWRGEAPPAVELSDAIRPRPRAFLKVENQAFGYSRLAQAGDCVILDYGFCGPDANPGHAHADFLSIELSVGAVRTIVDPGVPTYSEGDLRDFSRSAASHNGPSVVGAEPIEFWSSFRVGRRGYAHPLAPANGAEFADVVAGWQDGYAFLGLKVARAVRLYPNVGLLIVDLWQGRGRHAMRSNFLVSNAWRPEGPCAFVPAGGAGGGLEFRILEGSHVAAERSPYWTKFGIEESGWRLSFSPADDQDLHCLALWVTWDEQGCAPPDDWSAVRAFLRSSLASRPANGVE